MAEFDEIIRLLEHQGFVMWKYKTTKGSILVKLASIRSGRSEVISLRLDKEQPESAKVNNHIFYGYD